MDAGFWNTSVVKLYGKLDPEEVRTPADCTLLPNVGTGAEASLAAAEHPADEVTLVGADNPVRLASTFRAVVLEDDDLDNGGGSYPANAMRRQQAPNPVSGTAASGFRPNTGDLGALLGLTGTGAYGVIAAGNTATPPVTLATSTDEPTETVQEPSLVLELPDFPLQCYNGDTGDLVRAISIIPKEEVTSNTETGSLHHMPQFPTPISIRSAAQEISLNSIRCRIRGTDGRVAADLVEPTCVTLYVSESQESLMRRQTSALIAAAKAREGMQRGSSITNMMSNELTHPKV
jgi:hypothetical protein